MPLLLILVLLLAVAGTGALILALVVRRQRLRMSDLEAMLARIEAREKVAGSSLRKLEEAYASQSATCRVLEEELVAIARERDEAKARYRQRAYRDPGAVAPFNGTIHGSGWIDESEDLRRALTDQRVLTRAKDARVQDLQRAIAVAQNRYEVARQERQTALDLVGKLQHQLAGMNPLREKLARQLWVLKKTQRSERRLRKRIRNSQALKLPARKQRLPRRGPRLRERRATRLPRRMDACREAGANGCSSTTLSLLMPLALSRGFFAWKPNSNRPMVADQRRW